MPQPALGRSIAWFGARIHTSCVPSVTQSSALTYTTGANSMPQGASATSLAIDFNENKRQGSYHSQYFKLGYTYGLSDSLDLNVALNAYRHDYSGDPVPDEIEGSRDSFKFSGIQASLKKTLQPTTNDQLGLALQGLLKYDSVDNMSGESVKAWELEGKFIVQKSALDGRLQWLNNFQLEAETARADGKREYAVTTRIRSGVNYALNANWHIGLEGFWDYEVLKPDGEEWEFDHWDLFAGPAIGYTNQQWSVRFTLMPQIVGSDERDTSKTGRHLADHEKLNARLVVSYRF